MIIKYFLPPLPFLRSSLHISPRHLPRLFSPLHRSFSTSPFIKPSTSHFMLQPSKINLIISRDYASKARVVIKKRPVKVETKQKDTVPSQYQQPGAPSQATQQQSQPYVDPRGAASVYLQQNNKSLTAFIKRTSVWMAGNMFVSAGVVYVCIHVPFLLMHPMATSIVGFISAMGCSWLLNSTPTSYVQQNGIVKAVDSRKRIASFLGIGASIGVGLTPLLAIAAHFVPVAIPIAATLALTTMTGMVAYALTKPIGSFTKWGPALTVGLFALIGVSLVNIIIGSPMIVTIVSLFGVGLFAAYTAYDTHNAIQSHEDGQPDHLSSAANFYINAVNLFTDFLRLIMAFWRE